MDETTSVYIGDPPAEIAGLVSDTQATAATLAKAAKKAQRADCAIESSGRCAGLRSAVWSAMRQMRSQLDA